MEWPIFAIVGAAAGLIVSRLKVRSRHGAAARSAQLEAIDALSHLPSALQRTALWSLADGGFESRVVHGVVARDGTDLSITAFDLETLRERRGEWAYLPVDRPFRIGATVTVVVCELDRVFPHVLCKRAGRGDELDDDDLLDRATSLTKLVRTGLGVARSYPAELPATLPIAALDVALPEHWRAYGRIADPILATSSFHDALERAGRRDLVIELLESLVVIYPAAREVDGPDALADLATTALVIVDALRVAATTPRGIEHASPT